MREDVHRAGTLDHEFLEPGLFQLCLAYSAIGGDGVGAEKRAVEGHSGKRSFGERPEEALAEVSQSSPEAFDPHVVGVGERLEGREPGGDNREPLRVAQKLSHRTDGGASVEQDRFAGKHLAGCPFRDCPLGIESFERALSDRRLRMRIEGDGASIGSREQTLGGQLSKITADGRRGDAEEGRQIIDAREAAGLGQSEDLGTSRL